MISRSEDINAAAEKLIGGFRREALSAGGVLAVGNDHIYLHIVTQAWHQVAHCFSARPADHITDYQYPQWFLVTSIWRSLLPASL